MKSSPRSRFAGSASLVLAFVLALSARPAAAQIDLQLFRPAIDSKGYITLNASQVLRHLDVSFGLVVSWARRPLALSGPTAGGTWCFADPGAPACVPGGANVIPSRHDIDNLATGHLQAALGLFRHFEVGLGLPVSFWNGDTDPDPSRDQPGAIDAQGVGDLALHLKARVLDASRHPLGLGVVLSTTFPTGDPQKLLGSGRVGIHPSLILDKEFLGGRLALALNVGARILAASPRVWRDDRTCALQTGAGSAACGTGRRIESSHLLTYGLGATFYVVPQRLSIVAELVGQTGFKDFARAEALSSAHEVLAGLKLYLARNSYFALGVGRGLRGGGDNYQVGSPDLRVFAAFSFEPSIGDRDGDGIKDDLDRCPDDPEDADDFEDEDGCPDLDNDRDGIKDRDDRCPNEPETYNGFEDKDGCPDRVTLDRDGDGIPDDRDKCPDDPEDKDGFEDEDGCPDPDNDRDGLLDVDDLCPNDPEDKDGFEDGDGCPDLDNDKDGIPDRDDKCPDEPETRNDFEDEDGCPDARRVKIGRNRIEVFEKIYFETDKAIIKPVSFPILDAIAGALASNTQILLVEIQGHADERGSDEHNLKLTDDRAHAVRTYLAGKGVASSRLRAKGYGETRPVDRRHGEEAWSRNRRVEFVILKRAD